MYSQLQSKIINCKGNLYTMGFTLKKKKTVINTTILEGYIKRFPLTIQNTKHFNRRTKLTANSTIHHNCMQKWQKNKHQNCLQNWQKDKQALPLLQPISCITRQKWPSFMTNMVYDKFISHKLESSSFLNTNMHPRQLKNYKVERRVKIFKIENIMC